MYFKCYLANKHAFSMFLRFFKGLFNEIKFNLYSKKQIITNKYKREKYPCQHFHHLYQMIATFLKEV
jgi:hypothetical protein